MAEWHRIHDFFHGFGLREVIPDNEIVIKEEKGGIGEDGQYRMPVKWVRHKQEERVIWLNDCSRLLDLNPFHEGTDLEDVYARLEPLLKAEAEERRARYEKEGPVRFAKITIPKINRPFPQL